ncbi:lipopolysaccharide biosynthesis protein [Microbacterium esteraromaticum]|uniref:lipopolysaccharide biosynthesis protein n=1 Tax=Microbacterium esteraromaticum TaxID=57043 RepID=UPI002174FDF3|nr:hypothetical protein [Microbacterium esteraromaticum]
MMRGIASVLTGNLAVLAFNAVLIFGLPLFLSPTEYGYWQLFQLYTLVLGYVTFGVTDGVQLRYAGRQYGELDHPLFRTEFWLYLGVVFVANLGIAAAFIALAPDHLRAQIMVYACVGAVLFVPRTLLTMTLQATFRMTAYATITAVERLIVVVLTFALVLGGVRDIIPLLQADIAGKATALVLAVIVARSSVWGRLASARRGWAELVGNGRAGTSVLIANLSAMLVPSIARWMIEAEWSVAVFGSVSLAFNTANIVLVAVTSVAVVVFPWLRLLDASRLRDVYVAARPIIMSTMLSLLLFCIPLMALASWALPDYRDGLRFLALMFPVFVYEAQLRLIGTNYLKAMRYEKALMAHNLIGVATVFVLAVVAAFAMRSLELVVISVFIVTLLRASLVEAKVRRVFGLRWSALSLAELGVVAVFMASAWWLEPLPALGCVALALCGYWTFAARPFAHGVRSVRQMMRASSARPVHGRAG